MNPDVMRLRIALFGGMQVLRGQDRIDFWVLLGEIMALQDAFTTYDERITIENQLRAVLNT